MLRVRFGARHPQVARSRPNADTPDRPQLAERSADASTLLLAAPASTPTRMNVGTRLLVLSAVFATAVGSLLAEPKPAMIVQAVTTDDAQGYAVKLVKANELVKAKAGYERLRHIWVADAAGDNSQTTYVVSTFPSAAAAGQLQEKLKDDPDIKAFLAELKPIRKLGAMYLYKAVRLDGMYEGGAVFNTSINCTDEDAYVKALDGLKAIFDAHGFKDARINLWRAASGRSAATHLVVISLQSQARVGELIDAINDEGLFKEWNVEAAKIRTTVQNGSYHEITK